METILFSIKDQAAYLTLNRPEKRNAMNGAVIRELTETLHKLATDKQARVLIIQGSGDHFCAGADIAWMQTVAAGSYENNYDDAQALADFLYQLYYFPKPTIALVHGATMGGGMGLIAACDIAIAARNATFGFSEVKIGLAPSTISPYVIAAIGERAAHYYFLTGNRFDAAEAHRIQLIHSVVELNQLAETGDQLVSVLLQNGPNAINITKKLIRHVAKHEITADLSQKTAEHLANLRTSDEGKEGLSAFLEKRPPNWVQF